MDIFTKSLRNILIAMAYILEMIFYVYIFMFMFFIFKNINIQYNSINQKIRIIRHFLKCLGIQQQQQKVDLKGLDKLHMRKQGFFKKEVLRIFQ